MATSTSIHQPKRPNWRSAHHNFRLMAGRRWAKDIDEISYWMLAAIIEDKIKWPELKANIIAEIRKNVTFVIPE